MYQPTAYSLAHCDLLTAYSLFLCDLLTPHQLPPLIASVTSRPCPILTSSLPCQILISSAAADTHLLCGLILNSSAVPHTLLLRPYSLHTHPPCHLRRLTHPASFALVLRMKEIKVGGKRGEKMRERRYSPPRQLLPLIASLTLTSSRAQYSPPHHLTLHFLRATS